MFFNVLVTSVHVGVAVRDSWLLVLAILSIRDCHNSAAIGMEIYRSVGNKFGHPSLPRKTHVGQHRFMNGSNNCFPRFSARHVCAHRNYLTAACCARGANHVRNWKIPRKRARKSTVRSVCPHHGSHWLGSFFTPSFNKINILARPSLFSIRQTH